MTVKDFRILALEFDTLPGAESLTRKCQPPKILMARRLEPFLESGLTSSPRTEGASLPFVLSSDSIESLDEVGPVEGHNGGSYRILKLPPDMLPAVPRPSQAAAASRGF